MQGIFIATNLLLEIFYLIFANCTTLQMGFFRVDVDNSIRDDHKHYDVSLVDVMEIIQSKQSIVTMMCYYFVFLFKSPDKI